MTTIANLLGSVMTAVRLPRKQKENLYLIEKYVQAEFQKGDQAYVLECMLTGQPIDYRNIR